MSGVFRMELRTGDRGAGPGGEDGPVSTPEAVAAKLREVAAHVEAHGSFGGLRIRLYAGSQVIGFCQWEEAIAQEQAP